MPNDLLLISKLSLSEFDIKFYRKELLLFRGDAKYYCLIEVVNKLGTILAKIECSDIDLLTFLDNIYFYMESLEDIIYSFPMNSQNRIYTISINKHANYFSSEDNNYIAEYKDIMTIYSSILNEDILMNPICRIELNKDYIELLCKIIYNNYISNSYIDPELLLSFSPENHFVKN